MKRRYETKFLPPDHELPDEPDTRGLRVGDFGQILKISGLLFQGEDRHLIIMAPSASELPAWLDGLGVFEKPSLEEWTSILRQTDDPVVFQRDELSTLKAIVRKVQFQISGGVQWRIFERDDFQCMYCGRKGGDGCPLTVDHFVPLELEGPNNDGNYLTACRFCGKLKGSKHPKEFCEEKNYDYEGLRLYLDGKASRSFITHLK